MKWYLDRGETWEMGFHWANSSTGLETVPLSIVHPCAGLAMAKSVH